MHGKLVLRLSLTALLLVVLVTGTLAQGSPKFTVFLFGNSYDGGYGQNIEARGEFTLDFTSYKDGEWLSTASCRIWPVREGEGWKVSGTDVETYFDGEAIVCQGKYPENGSPIEWVLSTPGLSHGETRVFQAEFSAGENVIKTDPVTINNPLRDIFVPIVNR